MSKRDLALHIGCAIVMVGALLGFIALVVASLLLESTIPPSPPAPF